MSLRTVIEMTVGILAVAAAAAAAVAGTGSWGHWCIGSPLHMVIELAVDILAVAVAVAGSWGRWCFGWTLHMVIGQTADSFAAVVRWATFDKRHVIAKIGCWNDAPVADVEAGIGTSPFPDYAAVQAVGAAADAEHDARRKTLPQRPV